MPNNFVENPTVKSPAAKKPRDITQAFTNPQKPVADNGSTEDAARTRFAVDDVSPGGGVGSVGNGSKPFRVGGG